ncbi:hypothetical protein ACSQ67_016389 [Phaseolus vulgaris]
MKRGGWGIKRVKELGNNKCMDWSIKYVELVVSYLKEGKQMLLDEMKMKSVTLFFLFFLLLETLCCEGCLKEERKHFGPKFPFRPSFLFRFGRLLVNGMEWNATPPRGG